jgi:predicted amidohydrolase
LAITESSSGGIHIACAQLAPVFGDVDGNRARAAEAIETAGSAAADLVVLPELCITGYAFADESEACELGEPADGPTLEQWRALAAAHRLAIVGGFCELDADGVPRNSALLVDHDGTSRVYRKSHLWDREQLLFVAGTEPPPVIGTSAGRIGIAICYDAFFPEVMRGLALAGADIIAVPMNSPLMGQPSEPLAAEVVLALASAQINRVYVAQADRAGPERGIRWANASAICDPDGRLLAGPEEGTTVLHAVCDLERARDKAVGPRNDVLADRRPHLYATTNEKETVN